jgi:MFS family permease
MHLVLGVGAALCGLTPNVAVLVIAIGVAGAAATGTRAVVQTLAVTSAPANPSGATSVMLACQFGGAALAPLLWVPIFLADAARGGDGGVALVACGIPAVVAAIILAVVYRMRWVRA